MCYTIGYGGWAPQDFLDALTARGVIAVVDVRLRPNRAYMGTWVKAKTSEKGIERLLASEGLQYTWLPQLGNVYIDEKSWRELYEANVAQHGEEMEKLLLEIPQPFALMCAERKVTDCHREYIAAYLVQHGWQMEKIE
ncbi:MAG: DUF488 family protein [Halobacteriota archaeon]